MSKKSKAPKAVGGALPSLKAEELKAAPAAPAIVEDKPAPVAEAPKPKAEPKKASAKFDAQGRKILAKKQ